LDGATGRLKLSSGADLVQQAVHSICVTAPGERVMLPSYGAATSTFEPVDIDRQSLAVRESVSEYEPRANNVVVSDDIGPSGRVVRNVQFEVIGEANARTLTLPLFEGASK
jgi:phage baseplate assembly protein W